MEYQRIEPLRRSATRCASFSIARGTLPLMAHPQRWARNSHKTMKNPVVVVSLAFLVALLSSCSGPSEKPAGSTPLLVPISSEIVATLDTPIPKEKNALWCASFLAAWKTLAEQMAQDPISLAESGPLVTSLNNASDPRPTIPTAALYVATGWKQRGIVEQIHNELVQKFPSKRPPTFPGALPDSFIAYSYLEANVKFSLPYFQNRQPLVFTDAAGQKTAVASFGIRPEDDYAYYKLRAQPRMLFRKGEEFDHNLEFAIDLSPDSKPSQIVVALINREPTLAAALARVDKESREMGRLEQNEPSHGQYLRTVGPNDVLLVPHLLWQITHHFSELEGKSFANAKLKGQRLDVAQQDILFRLDRSGAELKSESKMYCLPVPTHFVLDRPFLIYMSQRGSKAPYFALWVDNAELLTKWPAQDGAQLGGAATGSQPSGSQTNRSSEAAPSPRSP